MITPTESESGFVGIDALLDDKPYEQLVDEYAIIINGLHNKRMSFATDSRDISGLLVHRIKKSPIFNMFQKLHLEGLIRAMFDDHQGAIECIENAGLKYTRVLGICYFHLGNHVRAYRIFKKIERYGAKHGEKTNWSKIVRQCMKCGSSAKTKKCSHCHFAHYCSRECQTKDWHQHKKECNVSVI